MVVWHRVVSRWAQRKYLSAFFSPLFWIWAAACWRRLHQALTGALHLTVSLSTKSRTRTCLSLLLIHCLPGAKSALTDINGRNEYHKITVKDGVGVRGGVGAGWCGRGRGVRDGEMKERDRKRKGCDGMNEIRGEREMKECMGMSLCPSLMTVCILYWADHLLWAWSTPSIKLQQMDTVKCTMTSSYAHICVYVFVH